MLRRLMTLFCLNNFTQHNVNMTVLHILTCCFAIMLIHRLFFKLLTAFIQNPHEH